MLGSEIADMERARKSSSTSSAEVGRQSKVAIPRLRRPSGDEGFDGCGTDKHRVSHACEPCRQRKTKCSGEKPICKHCADFKIHCFYADGKRDRVKNELITLRTRLDTYERLLEQMKPQVDPAGQMAITKALKGAETLDPPSFRTHQQQQRDGESLVTAEVGSTGSMDNLKEDVNTDKTPYRTGYMGKNSEVTWIQRVAEHLAEENGDKLPTGEGNDSGQRSTYVPSPGPRTSTKRTVLVNSLVTEEYQFQTPTYHLDDLSLNSTAGQVDPFLMPDKAVGDELLNAFFTTVHPTFPFVMKSLFMAQYEAFFDCYYPPGSSKRWMAMLNLMFAIGALYGKLTKAARKGSDMEHMKYFSRARVLSLDDGSILEVADLQQVQVIGLTGIFLIAINQTNRAWNSTGLGIRFAQTLGLHLRIVDPALDEVEREMRARLWWSLYDIDIMLCIMTGRPSAIQHGSYSAPLPRPVDEDQYDSLDSFERALASCAATTSSSVPSQEWTSPTPSSSNASYPYSDPPSVRNSISHQPKPAFRERDIPFIPVFSPPRSFNSVMYFTELTKLNHIISEVLRELYNASCITKTWSDVQGGIANLEMKVADWKSNLHPILDFARAQQDPTYQSLRLSLAFQYQNARMLINRPCLCRLDERIPKESSVSRRFNHSAAVTCIIAARESIALLSEEPNGIELLRIGPWWIILHYLVVSGTIIMVEIAMRAEHNPQQAEALFSDSKKVLSWLRDLAKDNLAAERSWAVLTKLLIVAAPKIGADTVDVERDFAAPPNMGLNPIPPAGGSSKNLATPAVDDMSTPFLLRGLMGGSFPFDNIPVQDHFDENFLNLNNDQHFAPPPPPSTQGNIYNFGAASVPDPMAGSIPPDDASAMSISDPPMPGMSSGQVPLAQRRQSGRMMQGVGSITLPPPPGVNWAQAPQDPYNRGSPHGHGSHR